MVVILKHGGRSVSQLTVFLSFMLCFLFACFFVIDLRGWSSFKTQKWVLDSCLNVLTHPLISPHVTQLLLPKWDMKLRWAVRFPVIAWLGFYEMKFQMAWRKPCHNWLRCSARTTCFWSLTVGMSAFHLHCNLKRAQRGLQLYWAFHKSADTSSKLWAVAFCCGEVLRSFLLLIEPVNLLAQK